MNLVGTESGAVVEVQGTAEGDPFQRAELDQMIDLGMAGIESLLATQARALSGS
jgi:ribonuclease PH